MLATAGDFGGMWEMGGAQRGVVQGWYCLAPELKCLYPRVSAQASRASTVVQGETTVVVAMDDMGSTVRYFGKPLPEHWRAQQCNDGQEVVHQRDEESSRLPRDPEKILTAATTIPMLPRALPSGSQPGWFSSCFTDMLVNATSSVRDNLAISRARDAAWMQKFNNVLGGNLSYATIAAMTFRQVLGDNSIVWYDGKGLPAESTSDVSPRSWHPPLSPGVLRYPILATTPTGPSAMMFVKGIGSSGDT